MRSQLRTLSKLNAEKVARHLVAAGRLVDDDPQAALQHARAARALGARVAVVREAVGETAYAAGEWTEAIAELRTARRMTGDDSALPMIADAERALGRADRALKIAQSDEAAALEPAERAEMRIVEAGARHDLGQLDAALLTLQDFGLDRTSTQPWSARVWYAYADLLLAADREDEAREWFRAAADADRDGSTDADERLLQLDGIEVLEDEDDALDPDALDTADADGLAPDALDAADEDAADDDVEDEDAADDDVEDDDALDPEALDTADLDVKDDDAEALDSGDSGDSGEVIDAVGVAEAGNAVGAAESAEVVSAVDDDLAIGDEGDPGRNVHAIDDQGDAERTAADGEVDAEETVDESTSDAEETVDESTSDAEETVDESTSDAEETVDESTSDAEETVDESTSDATHLHADEPASDGGVEAIGSAGEPGREMRSPGDSDDEDGSLDAAGGAGGDVADDDETELAAAQETPADESDNGGAPQPSSPIVLTFSDQPESGSSE